MIRPTIPADTPLPGKLVLVSALTPTPAGEGKTTVSIGLADGLRRRGLYAACALRQPSLGPTLGSKGGGAGGGQARLEPFARVNLGLTGDINAVGVKVASDQMMVEPSRFVATVLAAQGLAT